MLEYASQEPYQIAIDNFTHLYNFMMEQGQIPGDIFDNLGFSQDKDGIRNEALRSEVFHRTVNRDQNVFPMNFKSTFVRNALIALKMNRDARRLSFNKMQSRTEFYPND